MSVDRPAVSARGVLDGDPAALAGLCDLRGPSVLAYCDAICGPEAAAAAAAAAFAAFRADAVHAAKPLALNPDALLLGKARKAAAARAPDPSAGAPRPDDPLCPAVPRMLADAAAGDLAPADRHHLRRHLARCVPCRHAQNAQRAAERAYAHPPAGELPPIARQAMIAALRNAVPAHNGRVPEHVAAASLPGSASVATTPRELLHPAQSPPPAAATADAVLPGDAAETAASSSPAPRRPAAALGPRGDPAPVEQPAAAAPGRVPGNAPAQARPIRRVRTAPERHPTGSRERPAEVATGVIPVAEVAAALGYDGSAPPPAAASSAPPRRAVLLGALSRRLPGARVIAPAGVLFVALLVVLGIAGVFSSGGGHAPSVLTTPPPTGTISTAPGTRTPATAAAKHRARLRAARRRRAALARARAAAAAAAAAGSSPATTPKSTSTSTRGPASPTATTTPLTGSATGVPPTNGAAAATSRGYRAN